MSGIQQVKPRQSLDPLAEAYVEALQARAAEIRLPELFGGPHPDVLYYLPDRNGVSVVALRTHTLSDRQLTQILTYRLAQYVSANLIDPSMIYRDQMDRDASSSVSTEDIHIIGAVPKTGQILCYMVLRAIEGKSGITMRTRNRPLFPVEQSFGWGIYNELSTLQDMPVGRILEISRFVKNHKIDTQSERLFRGPVEITVAAWRILCEKLHRDISAMVGDIDVRVGRQYFGLFHIPAMVLPAAAPVNANDGFVGWAAQTRPFSPFAFLISDLANQRERLLAIEQALELPGFSGISCLLGLKRDGHIPISSLMGNYFRAQSRPSRGQR
jgi:hypothetical protein